MNFSGLRNQDHTDEKVASTHILPATLVTLGSDQNLKVKYASIYAFGALYITTLGTENC